VIIIDILHLVDRLEELLDGGWRIPLGSRVAIDEDAFLNIIDQMRIAIPQEIKQAREVQQERDKYVAQAHEEARQIIAQAREDAARLLDEHVLRQEAQRRAEGILREARGDAKGIRSGADAYAETSLKQLDEQIVKLQAVVRNGLEAIRRSTEAAQDQTDDKAQSAAS